MAFDYVFSVPDDLETTKLCQIMPRSQKFFCYFDQFNIRQFHNIRRHFEIIEFGYHFLLRDVMQYL